MKWLVAVVFGIASMAVGAARADEKKPSPSWRPKAN